MSANHNTRKPSLEVKVKKCPEYVIGDYNVKSRSKYILTSKGKLFKNGDLVDLSDCNYYFLAKNNGFVYEVYCGNVTAVNVKNIFINGNDFFLFDRNRWSMYYYLPSEDIFTTINTNVLTFSLNVPNDYSILYVKRSTLSSINTASQTGIASVGQTAADVSLYLINNTTKCVVLNIISIIINVSNTAVIPTIINGDNNVSVVIQESPSVSESLESSTESSVDINSGDF